MGTKQWKKKGVKDRRKEGIKKSRKKREEEECEQCKNREIGEKKVWKEWWQEGGKRGGKGKEGEGRFEGKEVSAGEGLDSVTSWGSGHQAILHTSLHRL